MDLFPASARISASAWLLAERIDLRGLAADPVLATRPFTVRVGGGVAVLFRYGAVVLFELGEREAHAFLASLRPALGRAFDAPETDDAEIRLDAAGRERVDPDGAVVLRESSLERLQVVAYVLARSALLAHYEAELARALDRVEGPVEELRREGRTLRSSRNLLQQIGEGLATETRMVGRAEVTEKPEIVWDRPDLDRLFVRLAEEYELETRDRAVARKLDLLSRTASTFLDLLQSRRSLHVEWYIVALIAVEILILVYDLFVRG